MATIRKRRGKWEAQVRRVGHRPLSKSFAIRKDAETWARHIEAQADRGELPPDRRVLHHLTLGDLVRRYRDNVSPRKRTGNYERIMLAAFLTRPICRKRISELTGADFAEYRDQRLAHIKPSSLRRELVPIRHLFSVARHEWRLPIQSNPVDGLSITSSDQRRERRLHGGELERLTEAARKGRNPLTIRIVLLAVLTGMRRGEILNIRERHIRRDTRTLLIPESKTGRARTIPLTNRALQLLPAAHDPSQRLFPLSANAFRLSWERLRKRAGLRDLHFHDLRHEAISRFFEAGLTVPEVASISGHSDMRMLFRYSHARATEIARKLSGNPEFTHRRFDAMHEH